MMVKGSGDVNLGTVPVDITGLNDDPTVSTLPTNYTFAEDVEGNVDYHP